MSTLYTTKHATELGALLRDCVGDSTLIRMMGGFFYFSAFKSFHETLAANPRVALRIVVGMDVELHFSQLVEVNRSEPNEANLTPMPSDREFVEHYLESLRTAVSAPEMDIESFHDRLSLFIELLKADRLQIRRSRSVNYARACLFDRDSGELLPRRDWLTGSMDLSRPTLPVKSQVAVGSCDFGAETLAAQFEALWDDAALLSEDPAIKLQILEILEGGSLASAVTPFEAYALLLKTYLDLQKQVNASAFLGSLLEDNGYKKYRYQLDAVDQALTILKEYNGVIIADVVGLGKSVVASLIINGLKKRGIIIAPPGLLGDQAKRESGWLDYKHDFRFYDWELFSSGLLENAWNYVKDRPDIEVVLIDEAHQFKNQETEDYERLSDICRGRQVILLTATPFNNRPADIFALLKLFILPGCSNITLDSSLERRFAAYDNVFTQLSAVQKGIRSKSPDKQRRARTAYAKLFKLFEDGPPEQEIDPRRIKHWARRMAREIRTLLEPVIIRRNRIDLRNDPDYRNEVTELSDMQPPVEQFFALTPEQSVFYDQIINDYFGDDGDFKGCLYQPHLYEKDEETSTPSSNYLEGTQQKNLYDFMRRLLVRRFESSFGAFQMSIERFLSKHIQAREFIRKHGKYIMDRDLLERLYAKDAKEVEASLSAFTSESDLEVTPRNKRVYVINDFKREAQFLEDLDADIRLFEHVREQLQKVGLDRQDPKADRLLEVVAEVLDGRHGAIQGGDAEPQRKVLVFSEYGDTVQHLAAVMEKRFPGMVASVSGAITNNQKHTINANFDAGFAKKGKAQDHFKILVATDKMSEGYNLNRAGVVINYDIPWNPTRVIQRVGRINRIGNKVFQNLYIFNFFPTERGADINRSREIAAAKMFMIHNTIGEDAQIFDLDETPEASSLFKKIQQNPESAEQESFLTTVKKDYAAMLQAHPELARRLAQLPQRIKTAKAGNADALYLFKRKGLGLFALSVPDVTDDELVAEPVSLEEAFPCIRCASDEPRLELGENFWDAYAEAKGALGQFTGQWLGGSGSKSLLSQALRNIEQAEEHGREQPTAASAFLPTLRLAIDTFGALSDYTLRRLARHTMTTEAGINKFMAVVEELRQKLGDGYLDQLHQVAKTNRSEIIVAIGRQDQPQRNHRRHRNAEPGILSGGR